MITQCACFSRGKLARKDKNNGALLLVFTQDRKMFLQTGYGLEGAMPDAICKRIIEDEIKPHFKTGDYDAGLTAGVNAILAAAKGEYKGTGRTHGNSQGIPVVFIIIFVIVVIIILSNARRGGYYSSSGWSGGGWGGGGGGWSGGGGGGGGGGGFSGGGGSTGGGGAGGSW